MAPRNGNAKMYIEIEKQNDYLQRKKEKVKNHIKYLKKKMKAGTATPDEKKELMNLDPCHCECQKYCCC